MSSCIFCYGEGTPRVKTDAGGEELSVCDYCWKLLQDPKTALPLIRGHLSLTMRGRIPADQLKFQIDKFMERIAGWKPKN
jgi:hypothetical protein